MNPIWAEDTVFSIGMIGYLFVVIALGRFANRFYEAESISRESSGPRPVYRTFLWQLCGCLTSLKRGVTILPKPGVRACPRCGQSIRPVQDLGGFRSCPVCGHHLRG